MRIEGCRPVILREDRRQRFLERRADASSDRRHSQHRHERRARHTAHVWFEPAFGAHLLGQITPEAVTPARAERAYLQPEARTPLKPNLVKRV
jgi:hypothetical protein